MYKIIITILILLSSVVQAEEAKLNGFCGEVALEIALVTNYRMSEGYDKTIKDFEKMWIDAMDRTIPFDLYRSAITVWKRDFRDPVKTYEIAFNECLEIRSGHDKKDEAGKAWRR
jgi:hypothetical protein